MAHADHLAKEDRRLSETVAVVFGGGRGIGRATALKLAAAGGDWDLVWDTNLKGPYLTAKAMLDLLRASGCAQVVNIASKVGLTGHEQVTAYTAAKAGLIGFGRALAQELSPDNIRVTTLCPGPVGPPTRWC